MFDPYIHATGRTTVLGFTAANPTADGEQAGDDLLRYLAAHPLTATHLAQKLCVRFVSDTPSADLVAAVAAAYLQSGTQILPAVSAILRSTEFWQSRGRKVRRPAENLLATIRVLGVGVQSWPDALNLLGWLSSNMGHRPLDWAAPNGYPDVAAAWRSAGTLIDTWQLHLGLAGAWWDAFRTPDPATFYAGARTSGEAVDRMTQRLTGMRWSAPHRAVLQRFLNEPAGTPLNRSVLQWMAAPLAAVVLDGPHHALR